MLNRLKNMRLKLRKAILHLNHILSIGILFLNLLVQTVIDSSLNDIWIIMSRDFAAGGVESCSMLCEQFNVFLCRGTSLVDGFTTLSSTFDQFLVFGFDFGMEAFEDG